ncbi:MAG TPA: alpha/beta hydrolase [Saprospiraceae bacterium]|nr:alpha/beta hydrolase [Saprospirales bacterium]HRQ30905.1 alpha/beta hydrolase [Saprospiraceae bacterium]
MEKRVYIHEAPNSFESKLIQIMLGFFRFKKRFTRLVIRNKFPKKPSRIPAVLNKNNHIEEISHEERKVWIITPKSVDPDRLILYFHGGAYLSNISSLHWAFIRQLLLHTKSRIVVPDYPLAPESNCEAVHHFAEMLYLQLLAKYPLEQIILMGDSAGGGLALALAQSLNTSKHKKPVHIILLSPWLDVTMSHPDIPMVDAKDKILSIDGLQKAGQYYAGKMDVKDFCVSPIYGDMSGLCPVSVFIGTHDLLWPDCKRFREMLESAGVGYRYFEYPGMFHDWMLVTQMKESGQVIKQISRIMIS